jgi:hypothetical protein
MTSPPEETTTCPVCDGKGSIPLEEAYKLSHLLGFVHGAFHDKFPQATGYAEKLYQRVMERGRTR